jgi:hypothetical protein
MKSSSPDIELGLQQPPLDGYAEVSEFIAGDPDNETFVFRRFHKTSARNLLYLQAEILELERRQEEYDREQADMELAQAGRRWETFARNAKIPDREGEQLRMELAREIRVKIKEYRTLFRGSYYWKADHGYVRCR